MNALPVRRVISIKCSKQHYNDTVYLAPVVSDPYPFVGSNCQVKIFVKGVPVNVLVDTGSPTSFIRADIADRLKLARTIAPPFRFRGVVSSESAITSESVEVSLELDDVKIKAPVYVTNSISFEIILGHPVISSHPSLYKLLEAKKPVPEYTVSMITEEDTDSIYSDATEYCTVKWSFR